MKKVLKYIRNLFITLVTFSGVSWLYRVYQKRNGPLVRIVVFHDVTDGSWFRQMVTALRERYHLITPEDFMLSRFHATRINILITFDDGYSSWVDVCLPILDATKTKALFFINSGLIEVSGNGALRERYIRDRLLIAPRAILSWEGVTTLRDSGHTIGGHTVSHTRLAVLEEREQQNEIVDDKVQIESHIGQEIVFFAYPFGQKNDYTKVTERVLTDSGYTYACTTEGAFVKHGEPYTVSRLCLESDMQVTQLFAWVEGGYDIYQKIKKVCVR